MLDGEFVFEAQARRELEAAERDLAQAQAMQRSLEMKNKAASLRRQVQAIRLMIDCQTDLSKAGGE